MTILEEKREVIRKKKTLVSYDDGGSFESIVREAEEAARGDEVLKHRLLTEKIITDLVNKQIQRASSSILNLIKTQETETGKKYHCVLGFNVPSRRRSGPCKKLQLPPQADGQNRKISFSNSLKRPFDQIQTETRNSNDGQEPIRGSENSHDEQEPIREPETKKPKKKRKINNNRNPVPQEIPEMPESFKNMITEMGGTKVVLVIQKHLTTCDLTQRHNRLSIPVNQIMNNFLEPHEKQRLERRQHMGVRLIQPCLNRVTYVDLRRWPMGGTFTYNLTGDWHKVVVTNNNNAFAIGLPVQLYSFRVENNDNELCFALVKI